MKQLRDYIPAPIRRFILQSGYVIKQIGEKFSNDSILYVVTRAEKTLRQLTRKKVGSDDIELFRKTHKIYDTFYFFNELDILDIRLHVLDPYVDYFVIVEATQTFTGLPKKLWYEENKERFKEFSHKIIHYVTTDTPRDENDIRQRLTSPYLKPLSKEILTNTMTTDSFAHDEIQWLKEFYQKESLKQALIKLDDDDFVFISDVDEIWNPEQSIDFTANDIYKYKQTAYYYFLNNRSNDNWQTGWTGTVATKYANLRNACINHLRNHNKSRYRYTIVSNGGWHFTFQGGTDRIKAKLASYGHTEFNGQEILSQLDATIAANKDYRGRKLKFWKDDASLPKYLQEHRDLYSTLFRP